MKCNSLFLLMRWVINQDYPSLSIVSATIILPFTAGVAAVVSAENTTVVGTEDKEQDYDNPYPIAIVVVSASSE